jgi:hypothetical protein
LKKPALTLRLSKGERKAFFNGLIRPAMRDRGLLSAATSVFDAAIVGWIPAFGTVDFLRVDVAAALVAASRAGWEWGQAPRLR